MRHRAPSALNQIQVDDRRAGWFFFSSMRCALYFDAILTFDSIGREGPLHENHQGSLEARASNLTGLLLNMQRYEYVRY